MLSHWWFWHIHLELVNTNIQSMISSDLLIYTSCILVPFKRDQEGHYWWPGPQVCCHTSHLFQSLTSALDSCRAANTGRGVLCSNGTQDQYIPYTNSEWLHHELYNKFWTETCLSWTWPQTMPMGFLSLRKRVQVALELAWFDNSPSSHYKIRSKINHSTTCVVSSKIRLYQKPYNLHFFY